MGRKKKKEEKAGGRRVLLSKLNQPQGPDIGASRAAGACNSELKLGDACDSCWRGIMLPPGGIAYYEEELKKYGYSRKAKGQYKIVCHRCGHWHTSLGLDFESGF